MQSYYIQSNYMQLNRSLHLFHIIYSSDDNTSILHDYYIHEFIHLSYIFYNP